MDLYTKENITSIIRDLFEFADVHDFTPLASIMRVSRKTIENWYSGYSVPKAHELFNLFRVLDVPPEAFLKAREKSVHDADARTQIDWWHHNIATAEDIECIQTIIDSKHGSSVSSVLKMMAAYLCLPLAERMRICHNILETYKFRQDYGDLIRTVRPKFLQDIMDSMLLAREAALNDKDYYNDFRG